MAKPIALPVTLTANPSTITEGGLVTLTATHAGPQAIDLTTVTHQWSVEAGSLQEDVASQNAPTVHWDTTGLRVGSYSATVTVSALAKEAGKPDREHSGTVKESIVVNLRHVSSGDPIPVTMQRAAEPTTLDQPLWVAIRASANQLVFQNYVNFVDTIMCPPKAELTHADQAMSIDEIIDGYLKKPFCLPQINHRRFLPFPNTDAYRVLKVATECFLMLNCGVYLRPEELNNLVKGSGWQSRPTPSQPYPIPPDWQPAKYDVQDDANRLNTSVATLQEQVAKWWTSYAVETDRDHRKALMIPYLALVRSRLSDLPLKGSCDMGVTCYGILRSKLVHPCLIELIWSYWHEEAMLVQTLNAISRRFQNFRGPAELDPLMRFDIDPLRPLNSLLWGYIQDEQHRLTVRRRAYEYNHEYGLTLEGKALRALRPSDSRSKFLEAFHNLLYLCTIFFKEDDDTTVVADGFPVLNALKEVHYILAAGAANQYGELPSTARQEMLMQQWLLARPEMREFLGGKIMVPYPEEWMDRVDNVKGMEGWTDVSVIHFHDLAVYGEQVVLSVRYGAWSLTTTTAAQAANWARYWRNEIQGYIHAYRAVTGIDLTTEPVNSTLPSVLLLKRLATQRPVAR
jgi:hypothetical protein